MILCLPQRRWGAEMEVRQTGFPEKVWEVSFSRKKKRKGRYVIWSDDSCGFCWVPEKSLQDEQSAKSPTEGA